MNQELPVKILKDENDRQFVPFTTSDAVFINGTDDTIQDALEGKQDTLVSGTNIKTINNESILGSGNIDIQGGGGDADLYTIKTDWAFQVGGNHYIMSEEDTELMEDAYAWLQTKTKGTIVLLTQEGISTRTFNSVPATLNSFVGYFTINKATLASHTSVSDGKIKVVIFGIIDSGQYQGRLYYTTPEATIPNKRSVIATSAFTGSDAASASNLGQYRIYTGTDSTQYRKNYIYKCVKETNIAHLTTTESTSIPLDFALNNTDYSVEIDLKLIKLSRWYPDSNLMMGADDNYNSAIFFSKTNAADIYLHCGCGGSENAVFVFTKPEYRTTIHYNEYNNDYGSYICSFNTDDWIMDGFNANNSNGNLTLFSSYGRVGMLAELYSFKVYDNSTSEPTLIHNLVPALNNGVPSLYDTITQTYYADTSSTMTYTAGGDVYYWQQVNTQNNSIKAAKIYWEDNSKIEDSQTINDLQDIILEYIDTLKIPNYMVDNYYLKSMWLNGEDEWNDNKTYVLEFYGIENGNNIYTGRIVVFTHYNNNVIYDNTSQDYYPRFEGRWGNSLAYDYQLYYYLSKDNTTEYTPTDDYNPATKKYVDEVKNYALLQYNQMPVPTKAEEIVQYKGVTNNSYKHSSFYLSKASGITVPVLIINTGSCFSLNYQYQDTDKLEIKFMSTSDVGDHGVLGNEEDDYTYMEMHFNSGIFYVGTGAVETAYSNYYEPNKTYTVEANVGETNDIIINNEIVNTGVTFGSNGTLKLFEYNTNIDYRGTFYYLRIYDKTTGNLKKEWIPALDQNDVPCIYETVGQTYIYNNYDNTGNQYDEVASGYAWELETEYLRPEIITNDQTTYTISNLKEHQLYNLGEITSLDITAVDNIYIESNIFLESGSTPTDVSLPTGYTHFGDAPTFTTASDIDTGTLDTNKKYVISILDGVFIWKKG